MTLRHKKYVDRNIMKNIPKESPLNKLKHRILKTKSSQTQYTNINLNTKRKNEKLIFKKIISEQKTWTEDYFTIPKESR